MREKLEQIETRFRALEEKIASPECYNDPEAVRKLSREQKLLEPVVSKYRELRRWEEQAAALPPMMQSSKST